MLLQPYGSSRFSQLVAKVSVGKTALSIAEDAPLLLYGRSDNAMLAAKVGEPKHNKADVAEARRVVRIKAG